jgi:hypothetical protein
MLIERLTEVGIDVFYSNTDGITAMIKKSQVPEYYKICKDWEDELGLSLEFFKIKKMVIRDVNNYILETEPDGKGKSSIKSKGDFNFTYKLGKQLDSPIVAKMVFRYFFNNIPVSESVYSENPTDYFISQKIGDDFFGQLEMLRTLTEKVHTITLPNINRYYASNAKDDSGYLFKIRTNDHNNKEHVLKDSKVKICNDITLFNKDDVNYRYYINKAMKLISPFFNKQLNIFES